MATTRARTLHWLVTALLLAGLGCGKKGSGRVKEEAREVDPFHAIEIGGAATLKASIGPKQSVVIRTDDDLIDIVETEVDEGVLIIRTREGYSTSKGLEVTVVTPSLALVKVSGAAMASLTGIRGASLGIAVSGAGSVTARGKAEMIEIKASGSGRVDTTGLTAQEVTVRGSGAASTRVRAERSLDARVSGSARVRYTGAGALTKHTVGSVKRL